MCDADSWPVFASYMTILPSGKTAIRSFLPCMTAPVRGLSVRNSFCRSMNT